MVKIGKVVAEILVPALGTLGRPVLVFVGRCFVFVLSVLTLSHKTLLPTLTTLLYAAAQH